MTRAVLLGAHFVVAELLGRFAVVCSQYFMKKKFFLDVLNDSLYRAHQFGGSVRWPHLALGAMNPPSFCVSVADFRVLAHRQHDARGPVQQTRQVRPRNGRISFGVGAGCSLIIGLFVIRSQQKSFGQDKDGVEWVRLYLSPRLFGRVAVG